MVASLGGSSGARAGPCQDMILLSFYFDQFYAHLMNLFSSPHKCFPYDLYDFMIHKQEQVYCLRMLTMNRTKHGSIK